MTPFADTVGVEGLEFTDTTVEDDVEEHDPFETVVVYVPEEETVID